MTIPMRPDEFVDLFLVPRVQVLELVHGLELFHVQPVGHDTVGFPLQEVLGLVAGDPRDGRKYGRRVRRTALDAVPLVNLPFTGLVVAVEKRHVVVEIFRAGAEVTTKQCRVGHKDGGHVDALFRDEDQADAHEPFVEHGGDKGLLGAVKDRVDGVLGGQVGVFGVDGEVVVHGGRGEPHVGGNRVGVAFESVDVLCERSERRKAKRSGAFVGSRAFKASGGNRA